MLACSCMHAWHVPVNLQVHALTVAPARLVDCARHIHDGGICLMCMRKLRYMLPTSMVVNDVVLFSQIPAHVAWHV